MGHGIGFEFGFWVLGFGFSFSFYFFSFLILILFQTQGKRIQNLNLNSHKHSTNKTMLQHDATTKIKPMINFNYLRIKIRLNASLNTIILRKLNKPIIFIIKYLNLT